MTDLFSQSSNNEIFLQGNVHILHLPQVLAEMTDGGLDYTFECVGNVNTMVNRVTVILSDCILVPNIKDF